ncbi:MAG: amidase family protein, partial [Treponema sp.]|nr:amidase family protein [Treponema sp.]
EGFSLLSQIAGHDERDGAMFPEKKYKFRAEKKELKWAAQNIPSGSSSPVQAFLQTAGLEEKISGFDGKYADVGIQVLEILAYAEISNNISRYDGIKFGYRTANYKNLDDLYIKTRTEALGQQAKLAAIMGCFVLSQGYYGKYYEKAMKIRRLIKESLDFEKYDILVLAETDPLAVLAGLPSLTFSFRGNPIQLAAGVRKENNLLSAWEALI